VVGGVIHVYVEVAGDEEFMRCGCRSGEKRCEFKYHLIDFCCFSCVI